MAVSSDELLYDLSNTMGNYQIAARLRSRRLIDLTTILSYFPISGEVFMYVITDVPEEVTGVRRFPSL